MYKKVLTPKVRCLLDDKSNENPISFILMSGTPMPSYLYANYYSLVI